MDLPPAKVTYPFSHPQDEIVLIHELPVMDQPDPITHHLDSVNGYELMIYEYRSDNPWASALFTPAMASSQWFYRYLAQYLAQHGIVTYTMDYSGIGGSYPEDTSLKGSGITIRDWVIEIEMVSEWLHERHPDLPSFYMAHSLGGQLFGLTDTASDYQGMISITSQNGYWRLYRRPVGYFFFWYVLVPPLNWLFGYFPSKLVGFGKDLPKKVMEKWKQWCTSENYFFDDPNLDDLTTKYTNYTGKILTLSFTDDPWATKEAVESLVQHYRSAEIDHRRTEPSSVGMHSIGHLGYFLPKSEPLWSELVDWMRTQA